MKPSYSITEALCRTRTRLAVALAVGLAAAPFLTVTDVLADGLYVTTGGNVGIGTATPGSYKLNVAGSIFGTSSEINGGNGNAQLLIKSTTDSQWDQSITFNDTGGDWVIGQRYNSTAHEFGIGTDGNKSKFIITSNGNVGIGAVPSTTYKLDVIGSAARVSAGANNVSLLLETTSGTQYDQSLTFRDGGGDWVVGQRYQTTSNWFGIGTSGAKDEFIFGPAGDLYAAGSVYADSFVPSDRRAKKDVHPIGASLTKVLTLTGISFRRSGGRDRAEQLGLVAQEVEMVFPQAVRESELTGMKTVNYSSLIAPLIEAIKEQQSIIEHERKANAELRARVERLERSPLASLVADEPVQLSNR